MNVSRALFLLLLFLPTSAFVWVFPSFVVLVLFFGLSVFFAIRHGMNCFKKFIKTWGTMAVFWAGLSTLATGLVAWEITTTQLDEAMSLLLRLLTLFLLAVFLNSEVSSVALSRAFSSLLRPLFKEKATEISLAVLLTASSLARKIESLKRFQSGLKIRFPNKGMLFRLRLLLLRLIEEIDTSADVLGDALIIRAFEKEAFWSAQITLTKKEVLLLMLLFLFECALSLLPSSFL